MKYKLLGNLKKDGKSYKTGDVIDLTEEEAKELGIVEKIKEKKEKKDSK